jgi:hypothetical protein
MAASFVIDFLTLINLNQSALLLIASAELLLSRRSALITPRSSADRSAENCQLTYHG